MEFLVPKFIQYQLYLLQLENYELDRYWKLLKAKGFWPKKDQQLRKELVWTAKARALLVMAGAMHVLVVVLAAGAALAISKDLDTTAVAAVVSLFVVLPFYFVLFSLALVIIRPMDAYAKRGIVKKAQLKIERLSTKGGSAFGGKDNLKIIGVAGSYGKTTTKEVLTHVLSSKYKVLSTPESINTPVGIARFILGKVTDDTQVLILEFGEHYRGDIKELCEIARPDIVVLTGINEAHMERMGSLENITATIFEAAEAAKESSLVVLNGDDENIIKSYKKYTGGREVRFYSSGAGRADYLVTDKKFDVNGLVWNFSVQHHGAFSLPLLGEYAIGSAVAGLAVGEYVGLSATDVKIGLATVRPVEHRLQPMPSGGNVLVIDDSYNGNPAGVTEAIRLLAKFDDRRKIYITPGLVETGSGVAEIHRAIGKQLAPIADVVVLIKDSVTPYVAEGLIEAGQKKQNSQGVHVEVLEKPQIIWFETALQMQESLKTFIQPNDVIMFQNDWGDQYI